MRRSIHGRASTGRGPGRRVVVALATLATFGGLIGVTQISLAETGDATPTPTPTKASGASNNGLQILGDNCDNSDLQAHTGFQDGNRCVSTAFGEVAAADRNPTLLIAEAPETVRVGQPFRLTVSTRNLVRDRFLGAAAGGYYLESAFLTDEGLTRGHFHTACRMLTSTSEAVDPAPVPAFFVATEDGRGGTDPDSVTIQVAGLPAEGIAQCAAWAGDGSHRIPMMQRANQVPALDAVRIEVLAGDEQPPAEEPPAEEPPVEEPPAEQPPTEEPPAEQPPAEEPPAEQPPTEGPRAGETPAAQPGGQQSPVAGQPDRDRPSKQPDRPGSDGGQQPDGRDPAPAAPTRNAGSSTPKQDAPKPTNSAASAPAAAPADNGAGGDAAGLDGAGGDGAGGDAAGRDDRAAADKLADDSAGGLAFTGVNTVVLFGAGALLIVAGIAITYLTRQRRYRTSRR